MSARLHTREDSGLVIDGEGRWLHDGVPVEHPKILEAFNRGLSRAPDGRYRLDFGKDWCFVTVLDAPLQVLGVELDPDGPPSLRFSNGVVEPLRPETLCHRGGVLYCESSAGLPARFSRPAQASLGEFLVERGAGYALQSGARSWPIAEAGPLQPADPRRGT